MVFQLTPLSLLFAFVFQTPGKAMGSLSAANAQFCFDVFKEMSYDHTAENLFFSPLSLLSALAVVLFGARGDSASQMEQVCHKHTFSHV